MRPCSQTGGPLRPAPPPLSSSGLAWRSAPPWMGIVGRLGMSYARSSSCARAPEFWHGMAPPRSAAVLLPGKRFAGSGPSAASSFVTSSALPGQRSS
eukprot:11930254-Alexandrium_andersonii.AAC.1